MVANADDGAGCQAGLGLVSSAGQRAVGYVASRADLADKPGRQLVVGRADCDGDFVAERAYGRVDSGDIGNACHDGNSTTWATANPLAHHWNIVQF